MDIYLIPRHIEASESPVELKCGSEFRKPAVADGVFAENERPQRGISLQARCEPECPLICDCIATEIKGPCGWDPSVESDMHKSANVWIWANYCTWSL